MDRKLFWTPVVVAVGVLSSSQSVWAQGRPPIYVPPVPVLPQQQPTWNWRPHTPLPLPTRPTLPVTSPAPVVQPAKATAVPVRAQPVAPARPIPTRPIRN